MFDRHSTLVLALALSAAPALAQRLTIDTLERPRPMSAPEIAVRLRMAGWKPPTLEQTARDVQAVARIRSRGEQLRFMADVAHDLNTRNERDLLQRWRIRPSGPFQNSPHDRLRRQERAALDRRIARAQGVAPATPTLSEREVGFKVSFAGETQLVMPREEFLTQVRSVRDGRAQEALIEEWKVTNRRLEARLPDFQVDGAVARMEDEHRWKQAFHKTASSRAAAVEASHAGGTPLPRLSAASQLGIGAALGVGITAATQPSALTEGSFWKGLGGSLAGGTLASAAAGLARGTPFGRLALALPVAGGMLGFDAATGQRPDWTRILAQTAAAVVVAGLLPGSIGLLAATAVMIGTSVLVDQFLDRLLQGGVDPHGRPGAPTRPNTVSLLDVKSGGSSR